MFHNRSFQYQNGATRRFFLEVEKSPLNNILIASSPSPTTSRTPRSKQDKRNDCRIRLFSSSWSSSSTDASPFYGTARRLSSRYLIKSARQEENSASYLNPAGHYMQPHHNHHHHHLPPLTSLQRLATLIHSSITALSDPTRADAVAAVGEVTGSYALSNMLAGMMQDEVGRRILHERPLVDGCVAARAMELLRTHNSEIASESNIDDCSNQNPNNSSDTIFTTTKSERGVDAVSSSSSSSSSSGGKEQIPFGVAYAKFLLMHEFDPNERSSVRFISDPDLSYVMTRYRQCHDYFHVLTGLPPTVLGELALKWLELLQTGLPLAALSATGGAWGVSSTSLSDREREVLWNVYLPWAVRVGRNMKPHALMCIYYEREFETDVDVLRERVGIELAPKVEF